MKKILYILLLLPFLAQAQPDTSLTRPNGSNGQPIASRTPSWFFGNYGGVILPFAQVDGVYRGMATTKWINSLYGSLSGLKPANKNNVIAYGDFIYGQGDSFIGGVPGSTTLPQELYNVSGRFVVNKGYPGKTSTYILQQFNADTTNYSHAAVICMGRNDYLSDGVTIDTATAFANIKSMVNKLKTPVYFIESVYNTTSEPSGSTNYNRIIGLNARLATFFGNRYLDTRSYIVSLYNPSIPEEVTQHNQDVTPTHLRSPGDGLHMNTQGNQARAAYMYARFNQFYQASKTYLTPERIADVANTLGYKNLPDSTYVTLRGNLGVNAGVFYSRPVMDYVNPPETGRGLWFQGMRKYLGVENIEFQLGHRDDKVTFRSFINGFQWRNQGDDVQLMQLDGNGDFKAKGGGSFGNAINVLNGFGVNPTNLNNGYLTLFNTSNPGDARVYSVTQYLDYAGITSPLANKFAWFKADASGILMELTPNAFKYNNNDIFHKGNLLFDNTLSFNSSTNTLKASGILNDPSVVFRSLGTNPTSVEEGFYTGFNNSLSGEKRIIQIGQIGSDVAWRSPALGSYVFTSADGFGQILKFNLTTFQYRGYDVWHSNNLTPSVPATASSVVKRDTDGYSYTFTAAPKDSSLKTASTRYVDDAVASITGVKKLDANGNTNWPKYTITSNGNTVQLSDDGSSWYWIHSDGSGARVSTPATVVTDANGNRTITITSSGTAL